MAVQTGKRHIRLTLDIPVPDADNRPANVLKRIEWGALSAAVQVALWRFMKSMTRYGMPTRNAKYSLEYVYLIDATPKRAVGKDPLPDDS